MAALTFKVGGDTSGLSRAVSSAKGMLLGLGNVIKAGALAGGALAIGALTTAVVGLKKALELGGRLSDVAANTGLLAGEAMILERALEDAGIGGEKLQATIQKMQKSIVEAGDDLSTPKLALDELKLSVDGLLKMNPAEQFAAIQTAIAGLSNPAERSARAMQLFGRSGGGLGALFDNPQAMEQAAESVGSQAEILNRSAGNFDRSADLLSGMGDKIRSFFVGLADFINPILLPVLEEFNKVDLAKIGSRFGEAAMALLEVFKNDQLGELVKESLLFGGTFLVNTVIDGFTLAGSILIKAAEGVTELLGEFFSGGNVAGFGKMMTAGLFSMTRTLSDMPGMGAVMPFNPMNFIPDKKLDEMEMAMNEAAADGMSHMDKALVEVLRNFARGVDEERMDPEPHRKRMEEIFLEALKGVREKRISDEFVGPPERKKTPGEGQEEQKEEDRFGFKILKPVVSSLGRIGGDGARGQSVIFRMDQERNKLLKDIAFNTGNGQTAVFG